MAPQESARGVRRISLSMDVALTTIFCAIFFFNAQDSIGPNLDVPRDIIDRVETSIIDQVGEVFFEKHLRYEKGARTLDGFVTCWKMVANYDQTIVYGFCLTVDHAGKPRKIPLPNCQIAPEQCGVFIGRAAAVAIAKEYDFDKGICPWETEFRFWSPDVGFAWLITNHLGPKGGRKLIIDAVSGSVVTELTWRGFPNPSN